MVVCVTGSRALIFFLPMFFSADSLTFWEKFFLIFLYLRSWEGFRILFFRKIRHKTRTNTLWRWKWPKTLGQHVFLAEAFWHLAFSHYVYHFVAISLVSHWSNGPSPCLRSRPWFHFTLPKFFGNRKFIASEKLAIINEKIFFPMASGILSTLPASCSLNGLVLLSNRWNNKNFYFW